MKYAYLALLGVAHHVASHATFQQLWVDGVDMIRLPPYGQCVRPPASNSPVTSVGSADIRCNVGGTRGVGSKCPVKAGGVVTIEMHQQHGDRSCGAEAIGGAHYGPVMAYLSSVPDAATADGSTPWFKIYENSWSATNAGVGDNDNWGSKDLNACCGRLDVPIPSSLPSGDYLLRAEVIALHALPAQLYMSCFQIRIEGGSGGSVPAGVNFPGAYSGSDPGLTANIHGKLSSYTAPGPKVVSGGKEVVPGGGCKGGCQATCTPGSGPSSTLEVSQPTGGAGGGGGGGCQVEKWGQCGGSGYTGCTTCAAGSTCNTSNQYYHQCV